MKAFPSLSHRPRVIETIHIGCYKDTQKEREQFIEGISPHCPQREQQREENQALIWCVLLNNYYC